MIKITFTAAFGILGSSLASVGSESESVNNGITECKVPEGEFPSSAVSEVPT